MVVVVPVRTPPERNYASQAPWKVIPRMRIDRLQLPQGHPRQHCYQVYISHEVAKNKRRADRAETQEEGLRRTGIFSCQPERRSVLVVNTVDGPVEWAPMHGSVQPVVVCVFDDEEERDLCGEKRELGEGECVLDVAEFHHRMEEDDQWQLDDEVNGEDVLDACPLVAD